MIILEEKTDNGWPTSLKAINKQAFEVADEPFDEKLSRQDIVDLIKNNIFMSAQEAPQLALVCSEIENHTDFLQLYKALLAKMKLPQPLTLQSVIEVIKVSEPLLAPTNLASAPTVRKIKKNLNEYNRILFSRPIEPTESNEVRFFKPSIG